MRNESVADSRARRPRRAGMIVALLVLAAACSLFRFGQRENDTQPLSDSDVYLDMARVFAGEEARFDPALSDRATEASHHYTRPALPFVAGLIGHYILGDRYRAAFSVVNILAAWITAILLLAWLLALDPRVRHAWVAPVLFLTGFPQLDWGYHILTDTLGHATALAAAMITVRLIDDADRAEPAPFAPWMAGLFLVQAAGLLARQTAWMVPVVALTLLIGRGTWRRRPGFSVALLSTFALASLPLAAYLRHYDLVGYGLPYGFAGDLDPRYVFDFLVKTGVAFHVAWIAAAAGLLAEGWRRVPDSLRAWGLAAFLYMIAGYVANSIDFGGYSLRLSYVLFPLVFYLVLLGLGRLGEGRRAAAVVTAFCVLYAVISVVGVLLDPATGGVRAVDLVPE
ncbi:MAG: hypothetical protein ABR527_04630 [Gemmatimonadota bacterium]